MTRLNNLIFIVLAVFLTTHARAAIQNDWTYTGGPYGGSARKIVVHPSVNTTLYAIGQGGMYRSTNSGAMWQRIERGLPAGIRWVGNFWVAPSNGDVLYLHLRRIEPDNLNLLYRSVNGGDRWERVSFAFGNLTLRDLTINTQFPNQIALVTNTAGPAGLFLSSNSGRTFTNPGVGAGYPAARAANSVAWSGSTVLVGIAGPGEIWRSVNNGGSFSATPALSGSPLGVGLLRFAPNHPSRVFALANYSAGVGGFSSSNNGVGWSAWSAFNGEPWISPLNGTDLLQISETFTGDDYDSTVAYLNNATLTNSSLIAPPTPVFRSVAAPSDYISTNDFYLASASSGLFKTLDNGATLASINQGFRSVSVVALESATPAGTTLYAGQADGIQRSHGMFRSTDGGVSWIGLNLNAVNAASILGIAVDPTTPTTLYAVGLSRTTVSSSNQGVYKSINGGASWSSLSSGLPVVSGGFSDLGRALDVELDPRSCLSPPLTGPCITGPLRTMYVVSTGSGTPVNANILYKSTNAGVSFVARNVGLTHPPAGTNVQLRGAKIAIDPSNPQILYLATFLDTSGTAVPGVYANGVFKSVDGGANWVQSNAGLPSFATGPLTGSKLNVFALVIDPQTPTTLYAAVSNNSVDGSPQNGIYKSTNSGVSWSNVSNGLVGVSIRALLADPNQTGTLYAAGTGTVSNPGGVFKTTNAGGVWRSISTGLPADAVFALHLTNTNILRAGTNVGVMEYANRPDADSDGPSTEIEDLAPNAGDSNGDGILDSTQASVASFEIQTQSGGLALARRPEAHLGRSNYGSGTTDNTLLRGALCNQLVDVYGIDPSIYPDDVGPDGILYDNSDRGMVSFEVPDCASVSVVVRFHDGLFNDPLNWKWRNYGPQTPGVDGTLGWYTFTGAQQLDSERWRLTINAGQPGTYRSSTNAILFRGGPSFFPEHFKSGFE